MPSAKTLLKRVRGLRSSTTRAGTGRPDRVQLRGGNWAAYADDTSRELLVAGPAGSGKTLTNLWKLYDFAAMNPGARMLIVRKTRRSLTESALATWESAVLGPGHPVLRRPLTRGNRHEYRFPNRSVLVTGGMDHPDKVLSTEWDRIYVPETTDLTLSDWETLTGRLRGTASARCAILGDCNPTTPTHWLYKRCQSGKTTLYPTTHKDNPRFWLNGQWTPDGVAYVQGVLGALTGARKLRFLEGVWAEAEGLVYDGYSAVLHLLPEGWVAPAQWRRVWSIDWGYRNPIVLQSWAIDGDGRMYLEREYYKTQTRAEHLALWARREVDAGRMVPPESILCDHDPDCQATFETYFGQSLRPADKVDQLAGIQATQARFDAQGDGRPRIFFARDALAHEPDADLHASGKPTNTLEELAAYCWRTDDRTRSYDEPVKANDHGCDALRYCVRHIDATHDGGGDAPRPPVRRGGLHPDTFR